jgi:glutamate formiminotransferase
LQVFVEPGENGGVSGSRVMLATGNEPLLESVPNVSEGRRREVIEELVAAALGPGVTLLDHSSDRDHHRSVLTLAGRASALHEGLLDLCRAAFRSIDLRHHHGVHPRVGAVDLVPFVPLAGATMADATAAARRLGVELARALELPVFLYGAAASDPGRRHPATFRRGGCEELARRLAVRDLEPDHGPSRLHPSAGAVLVGARDFLIAINARLATSEIEKARRMARRLRESSGGLPGVQALGFLLPSRGRTQVSINLLDWRRTSLGSLLESVRQLAREEGVAVDEIELVGLVPEAALEGGGRELQSLVGDRIVERRLAAKLDASRA